MAPNLPVINCFTRPQHNIPYNKLCQPHTSYRQSLPLNSFLLSNPSACMLSKQTSAHLIFLKVIPQEMFRAFVMVYSERKYYPGLNWGWEFVLTKEWKTNGGHSWMLSIRRESRFVLIWFIMRNVHFRWVSYAWELVPGVNNPPIKLHFLIQPCLNNLLTTFPLQQLGIYVLIFLILLLKPLIVSACLPEVCYSLRNIVCKIHKVDRLWVEI